MNFTGRYVPDSYRTKRRIGNEAKCARRRPFDFRREKVRQRKEFGGVEGDLELCELVFIETFTAGFQMRGNGVDEVVTLFPYLA
jgi:hypothetical protein